MKSLLLLAILLLPACPEKGDDTSPLVTDDTGVVDTGDATGVDGDGDGFTEDVDCDDSDVSVYPGAAEVCDGVDNNCNGAVDEGLLDTWYLDADGDGFGDVERESESCTQPLDYVDDGSDCNDLDAEVHPDATETCDGIDNDCDGLLDEDDAADVSTWYRDADGDGWGVYSDIVTDCDLPAGYALNAGDCDDADPAYHPGASESDCTDSADYNCDGSVGHADADGDGWAACEDCDDADAAVNEDAIEVCDGVDNDCNGFIDSDDPGVTGTTVYYGDADGDGYGGQQFQDSACEVPPGYVANADDCDDVDASSYPGASEVCDGVDNDCDSDIDEGVGVTWYQDYDSDGYGNGSVSQDSCDMPSGYVGNALDCDDFSAATNPSSYEVCDGVDNDCDGETDEDDAINTSTWYGDGDADGYGTSASSISACSQPSGHADNASDCDDTDAAISPAASELCDGIDNDCDGTTDGANATDTTTWYADVDGDGYGNASSTTGACSQPSGFVSNTTDCDDTSASTNPGGTELCDFIDNDCDGVVDEDDASDAQTWYFDGDGDGYGISTNSTTACIQPTSYSGLSTDCDDTDVTVNPGATEQCDGADNDCDGTTDNDLLGDGAACAASTCLGILNAQPSAASGTWWLDPDGSGAQQFECDMDTSGGGWTRVYTEDFEINAGGWSHTGRDTCGSLGSTFLGGYNQVAGGSFSRSIDGGGVSHGEALVRWDYIRGDSWDGETAYMQVDGTTWWSTNYSHGAGSNQCGGSWSDERHADLSQSGSQGGSSMNLTFGSGLDEGATNEWFGIDNVSVWLR